MKKTLIIFFISAICLGFKTETKLSNNKEIDIPKDFYFNIDLLNADYYNGRKKLYYRQYSSGVKGVKLKLNRTEKAKIFKHLADYNFDSFPDNFDSKDVHFVPTDSQTKIFITAYYNGKLKTVTYNFGLTDDTNKAKAKSFLELYQKISEFISKKKIIRNLPKSDYNY